VTALLQGIWVEPVTLYIATTLAVLLGLTELVLPTFGVAGSVAAVLALVSLIGLTETNRAIWPFALIGLAFIAWVAQLVTRNRVFWLVGTALFGVGSVAYALDVGRPEVWVAIALATVLTAAVVPPLEQRLAKVNDAPPTTGIESYVGHRATVDSWSDGTGTVLFEGSRWTARLDATGPTVMPPAPPSLGAGDSVTITGYDQMTLLVRPPGLDRAGA
jgi:membrane-bound ClpP family serine protease